MTSDLWAVLGRHSSGITATSPAPLQPLAQLGEMPFAMQTQTLRTKVSLKHFLSLFLI